MEEKLVIILNEMAEYLSIAQMKKLQEVLLKNLAENEPQKAEISNAEYLQMFLDAKKIEGCSERTLQYYRVTVERMLQSITTPIRKICTEEIRSYLSGYQQINGCGKVTVDNIRRNISSFSHGWKKRIISSKALCGESTKSRQNNRLKKRFRTKPLSNCATIAPVRVIWR